MTKFEIAVSQLNSAIEHFDADEFVPAITLSGAAEEILGELCKRQLKNSSLERHAKDCCNLYLHLKIQFPEIFSGNPTTKPFIDLRNQTKNELKHLISGNPIEMDFRDKAGRLIAHAIENYIKLCAHETELMRRFQEKRLNLLPPYDLSMEAPAIVP